MRFVFDMNNCKISISVAQKIEYRPELCVFLMHALTYPLSLVARPPSPCSTSGSSRMAATCLDTMRRPFERDPAMNPNNSYKQNSNERKRNMNKICKFVNTYVIVFVFVYALPVDIDLLNLDADTVGSPSTHYSLGCCASCHCRTVWPMVPMPFAIVSLAFDIWHDDFETIPICCCRCRRDKRNWGTKRKKNICKLDYSQLNKT